MRKEFCSLVNKVFGLNIDVEVKQTQSEDNIAPEGEQSKDYRGENDQ